jgi:hypothetical protein
MQSFKIENFERESGTPFPPFSALSVDDCESLRRRLAERLGLPTAVNGLDLVRAVGRQESRNLSLVGGSPGFDLRKELTAAGIDPPLSVYLNWYRYDDIDEMRFDDLSRYFDDIWYPSSDDLDVFDSSLRWILSVDHDGYGKVYRLRDGVSPGS